MLHVGRRKRKRAETLMIYRDRLARKNKVGVVNRHSWPTLPGEKPTRTIAVFTGCKYHQGKGLALDDQGIAMRTD